MAQETKALFDFPRLCVRSLTEPYHGLHSVAFRLFIQAIWQANALGHMVGRWVIAAWERIQKNNNNHMGTWESNPGPSTHQACPLPIELLCAFVYIMNRKYNIQKTMVSGMRQKITRQIWMLLSCLDTSASSSSFSCK